MPRTSSRFVCQACGCSSPRWLGRCPECAAWNSFIEEAGSPGGRSPAHPKGTARPEPINGVPVQVGRRWNSGLTELDRVLGGGIVPGSVILVGGDPGIGKSTLLTQVSHNISSGAGCASASSVLYVSGEESVQQIRMRCDRLGAASPGFLVMNETDVGSILQQAEATEAVLLVVDSIQTVYDPDLQSPPGTVSQVRECANHLVRLAKGGGAAVFLIGHVTKEGSIAGPRVLEHMVDTVLYFEGDRHHAYRILRAVKNRFGSTDEIGIFEMGPEGLAPVENASAALLAQRSVNTSGSAVAATLEGSRSLLVEVQSLVTRSYLAAPRRLCTGIDYNRVNMLVAVLEKRLGLRLGDQDIFVNVAGGVRVMEPAADLAVASAVASNFWERPVEPRTVLVGEVGLGGEVRAVPQLEKRLAEAERMGFARAIVSRHQARGSRERTGIKIERVASLAEALRIGLMAPAA
ncbi:MAG: DNA repair protein RadA [Chthonomonadales bacterium]